MFQTRIKEIFSSYLGRHTAYPEVSSGFLQSLQENSGLVPLLGHGSFLSNPFQFNNSSSILTLDAN
jgi:hypothetical protein